MCVGAGERIERSGRAHTHTQTPKFIKTQENFVETQSGKE